VRELAIFILSRPPGLWRGRLPRIMLLLAAESARNRRNVIESNSDEGARACTRRAHSDTELAKTSSLRGSANNARAAGSSSALFSWALFVFTGDSNPRPFRHDRPLFFRASHARVSPALCKFARTSVLSSVPPPLPPPHAARVSFVRRRGANPHDATPPITPS
jgi:hypothetical protein